jgi:hypothetical protein
MIREALIRLANEHPEFRKHLIPLIRGEHVAKEFTNKKQLDQYLKDHPKADRQLHTVKDENGGGPKKDDAPPSGKKGPDDADKGEGQGGAGPGKVNPEKNEKKVKALPEDLQKKLLDGYKLDLKVVEDDDLDRAIDVAKKLSEGIDKSADVCKVSPPVCNGNLGLTRAQMPQIPGDMSVKKMLKATKKDGSSDEKTRAKGQAAIDAGADPDEDRTLSNIMLDLFRKQGVKVQEKEMKAGKLKATQAEIQAKKTIEFADSYLSGTFQSIGQQIVISKDGHILDGHHRWAALLTADPDAYMDVLEVDLTMKDMLDQADAFPGVYRENLAGDPIPMTDEIKKKKAEYLKKQGGKK